MLESAGILVDAELIDAWRRRALRAAAQLHWPPPALVTRSHPGGTSFALQAPIDQLFVATEVNEWALCASQAERDPAGAARLEDAWVRQFRDDLADRSGGLSAVPAEQALDPALDEHAAMARFARMAAAEARPALRELLSRADDRGLPYTVDDDFVTLGSGAGGRSYALDALPEATAALWSDIHAVPTALVTGSNGKTTTVRLLAACARALGLHAAYNCTDGVFLDLESLAAGDYAGPAGARIVLRERRAGAAIIETARGGILRRGIALSRWDAAVVTNVSADHFGEYGIYDLQALADAKLTVAAGLGERGLLVLNADDEALKARAMGLARRFGKAPRVGWFSGRENADVLREARGQGRPACAVRDGRLCLVTDAEHDLGAVADMPLSMGGAAAYNVANLAAAALTASALGTPPGVIGAVFATFGLAAEDNPGRMMRFHHRGLTVLIDYAHNPDGLRGFLEVARHMARGGRFGIVLGHAGNRTDEDIRELARTAAAGRPHFIVIKENETLLRGRAPGEVPGIIRDELRRLGVVDECVTQEPSELAAVRRALDWARSGDLLALPVHSPAARAAVLAMLRDGPPTPVPTRT